MLLPASCLSFVKAFSLINNAIKNLFPVLDLYLQYFSTIILAMKLLFIIFLFFSWPVMVPDYNGVVCFFLHLFLYSWVIVTGMQNFYWYFWYFQRLFGRFFSVCLQSLQRLYCSWEVCYRLFTTFGPILCAYFCKRRATEEFFLSGMFCTIR